MASEASKSVLGSGAVVVPPLQETRFAASDFKVTNWSGAVSCQMKDASCGPLGKQFINAISVIEIQI